MDTPPLNIHEDPHYLKKGVDLFKHPVTFVKGCVAVDHLPETDLPEVAFAGRSNVGKSSILNALSNQKNLARTSNTPGRTQEINYFNVSNQIHLVDLPGYGFAEAPRKKVLNWQKFIRAYLRGRPHLRRVFILIDSRHGIKKTDIEIMKLLDEVAVPYQIILTKADKISEKAQKEMHATVEAHHEGLIAKHPIVHLTSSQKKKGLEAVKAEIASFC